MNRSAYNFEQCKLCGQLTAEPCYRLADASIYVCQSCDFHFLDYLDNNSAENDEKASLDDKARRYIESRLTESSHLHPQRINFVQRFINLNMINTLDIGAGLGQFQLLVEGKRAKSYGIEPSQLRRQYAAEKSGIKLYQELVDHPFWQGGFPGHFDLITLWDVIEHVNFPRKTLEDTIKLLKPGGLLALDTPSRDTLPYRLSQKVYRFSRGRTSLFLPSFYSSARYGHKQIFTRKQLTRLLEDLGLRILGSHNSYIKRITPGNKIILAAQKPAVQLSSTLETAFCHPRSSSSFAELSS